MIEAMVDIGSGGDSGLVEVPQSLKRKNTIGTFTEEEEGIDTHSQAKRIAALKKVTSRPRNGNSY